MTEGNLHLVEMKGAYDFPAYTREEQQRPLIAMVFVDGSERAKHSSLEKTLLIQNPGQQTKSKGGKQTANLECAQALTHNMQETLLLVRLHRAPSWLYVLSSKFLAHWIWHS